jgi:hypothetical protein
MSDRRGKAKGIRLVALAALLAIGVIGLFCAVVSFLRDDFSELAAVLIPAVLSFGILYWCSADD